MRESRRTVVLRKNVKDFMYGSVIRVLLPCDKTKICHVIDKTGFPTPAGRCHIFHQASPSGCALDY